MKEQNIRKLSKSGRGTVYVTLPKDMVASFGWKEHQKLAITRGRGCIIIRDWKKR